MLKHAERFTGSSPHKPARFQALAGIDYNDLSLGYSCKTLMLLVDSLAEEHILAAIRRGEFDDLAGQGQPLILENDSAVPEALRVGYRILKNSGFLPAEVALRKEIREVESLLNQVETGSERQTIRRRLCLLTARLAMHSHDVNLLVREQAYREKLIAKIAPGDRENTLADPAETSIAGTAIARQ